MGNIYLTPYKKEGQQKYIYAKKTPLHAQFQCSGILQLIVVLLRTERFVQCQICFSYTS